MRNHAAFTLVELLVVIVILGIMAMMLGPTFTAGTDMTRVRTAARGVMQMSRYARTMAVLYQIPVELELGEDGGVRVGRGDNQGNKNTSIAEPTQPKADEENTIEHSNNTTGEKHSQGQTYTMTDLEADKLYPQVRFVVKLDDLNITERELRNRRLFDERERENTYDDAENTHVKTVKILYESNGRCLPYQVRITPQGDESDSAALTVEVDRFGVARIREDE